MSHNPFFRLSQYELRHLPYHLAMTSDDDSLRRLLLDFWWMAAKLTKLGATELNSLITDYDFLPANGAVQVVQGALRLAAHVLANDTSQLATQLLARLLATTEPELRRMLSDARPAGGQPWLRPLTASLMPPGGPLLRTLTGHRDNTDAIAVTPDGTRAVSLSLDQTLRLWELATGRPMRSLAHPFRFDQAVAITPDGRRAVSASNEGGLKVWDLEAGVELHTLPIETGEPLPAFAGSVRCGPIAIATDDRRIFTASNDGFVRVLEIESGRELHVLACPSLRRFPLMFLHEVALAPEGRRVVSTEPDGTLRVWEIDTGREWSTLTAHSRQAHCVSVTSDGRWAVSAEGVPYDGEVKVWDLDSGREIASLPMHSFQSAALSVTPRWRRVVMASGHDRRLKVWDLDDGRVYPLAGHSRQVHTVTITAHGRLAVSGGLDGTLRVWDIEAGAGTPSLNGHTKSIEELAVLPDGRIAVSASADETLKVWDFETGLELYTHSVGREHRPGYSAYRNWGLSIAATEKGGRAIFFCADGTLRIVDLNSATELRSLKHGHDDPLYLSLAITPDVRLAVTAGEDATKVWDLEHGHELRSLPGLAPMHVPLERFRADLRRIALTPDGRHAIFAQTEALVVRDLFTGDDLLTLRCPAAVEEVGARLVPNCLFWALSENGRRAIVVSKHAVTAWDLRNGRELQTFAGGTDWLDRVAATADLRRVLISTAGGALEVLDLDAGRRLHLLRGHTDAVLAVAIAADGRRGFSGSRDMTVRVWDLEQGVLESTFTTDAQVTNIASDAAGWKLCAGDWRGGIHLLALEEVGA